MAIKRKNGVWGYDIRVYNPSTGKRDKRVRCYEFEEEEDARAAEAQWIIRSRNLKHGFTETADSGVHLSALLAKRLTDIPPGDAHTMAKRVFDGWLELLPESVEVQRITTPDIRLYREKREADGVGPSSVRRELNIISSALHAAGEYFSELSAYQVPKIPRPKVKLSRRERLIGEDEYAKLIAWLSAPGSLGERPLHYRSRQRVALIMRFLKATGLRSKELFLLKWSDIEESRIKIFSTKTKTWRYIPLAPSLRQILIERRECGESIKFVFSLSGRSRHTDYDMLREACQACDIPYGRHATDGLEYYSNRHTVITEFIESGLSLTEVATVTGHSPEILLKHYGHLNARSNERIAAQIERLSGHDNGQRDSE